MALLYPWRVTVETKVGEIEYEIFAPHADWAMHEILLKREGHRHYGARKRLVAAGTAVAERVSAWRVLQLDGPRREWALHASDTGDAAARGATALSCRPGDLYVEPVDELVLLRMLTDTELEWLARHAWREHGPGGDYARLVPSLYRRSANTSYRDRSLLGGANPAPLHRPLRLQAIYALRLAMEVPMMGPDPGWPRGHVSEEAADRQTHARGLAYSLHGDNVSPEVVEACLDAGFANGCQPYTAVQREALAELARAYGYEPSRLVIWDLVALWEGGPTALRESEWTY